MVFQGTDHARHRWNRLTDMPVFELSVKSSLAISNERRDCVGMTKLMDANDAGGRYSADCTLILTEGDSAKSLVVGGLSVAGRDKFGVFPLR